MSTPGGVIPVLLASAAGGGGAVVERSLRFNTDDSAYLSRGSFANSDTQTMTFAFWLKRSLPSTAAAVPQYIFAGGSNGTIYFDTTDDKLQFNLRGTSGTNYFTNTLAELRDFSAWYHIVVALDLGNATQSERFKCYINGVEQDMSATAYPSNDFHAGGTWYIGSYTGSQYYPSYYLADFYYVAGQALTPGDFAETDATTGQWVPKEYSGSYGTNGFHLPFSDNSSVTALGTDTSGNANDWTLNNFTAGEAATTGFKTLLYTGNGGTQSVTGAGFSPDFVWIKRRDTATSNLLYDTIRGTGATAELISNATSSEGSVTDTDAARFGYLSGFGSDGFTVQAGSTNGVYTNQSSSTYVAWCWDAGGSTVSNTDGSITSSVRANASTGFSIVSYTGNGLDATIGHGLSSAPKLIIKKFRSAASSWDVYHESVGAGKRLVLNTTAAESATSSYQSVGSSTFDVHAGNNDSGVTMIAYCWTPISGVSSFGSYSGNGSTQTITTGFKPAFILFKRYDSSADWYILDSKRVSGTQEYLLSPNNGNAETSTLYDYVDFNSDGFTLNTGSTLNGSGSSYVYAAFAEHINGSDIDSLFDSASTGTQSDSGLGGEVSGNYAVFSDGYVADKTRLSTSNGNLDVEFTNASSWSSALSSIAVKSGKWYVEMTCNSVGGADVSVGLAEVNLTNYNTMGYGQSWGYRNDAQAVHNGSGSSYGATWGAGDVLGIALDMDGKTVTFYKNGSSQGQAFSSLPDRYIGIGCSGNNTSTFSANYGQRAFAYTAPSGYKALCTTNLTDPTIADPSDYMDVLLWTGNGSAGRAITGLGFSPDLVWVKSRSAAYSNALFDTVRGVYLGLQSNVDNAEASDTDALTAFNSDGFTVGTGNTIFGVNTSSQTFVAWTWDAGSSTVSNTDGSITSSVRANQSAGFSIVSFNAGSSGNKTVGHGLNADLGMFILKDRDNAGGWQIWHKGLSNSAQSYLQFDTDASANDSRIWANTAPTSSVFSFEANYTVSNNVIGYCWSPVAGYSAFGSYTGNGSSDGTFVYTGFRPRFVLAKRSDSADGWYLLDAARDNYNGMDSVLAPNDSAAEFSTAVRLDSVSNGFKLRTTSGPNQSGGTYIYAAFAEHPFKYANAR